MEKKLYVGNISFKATEEDIRELFARNGEVESVKIITDAHTGNPKGFGGDSELVARQYAPDKIAQCYEQLFQELLPG